MFERHKAEASCLDRFGAERKVLTLFCMFFKLLVDSVRYTKYPLLVTGKTVIGRRNPRSHRRRRS